MDDELIKFKEFRQDAISSDVSGKNQKIIDLSIKDVEWRINSRKEYGKAFMFLLFFQNITVFCFVGYALGTNRLQQLDLTLGTITSATLIETFFTIRIIIKWLFKDINYSDIHRINN